jgi:hypothetical protein
LKAQLRRKVESFDTAVLSLGHYQKIPPTLNRKMKRRTYTEAPLMSQCDRKTMIGPNAIGPKTTIRTSIVASIADASVEAHIAHGAGRTPKRSMVRIERNGKFRSGARTACGIDPLFYGRHGSLAQDRIATQHLDGLHISLGPDGELEAHGPSNVQTLQSVGVIRLDLRD